MEKLSEPGKEIQYDFINQKIFISENYITKTYTEKYKY